MRPREDYYNTDRYGAAYELDGSTDDHRAGNWFQSDDPFDASWHLAINACYAACGASAHPNLTWVSHTYDRFVCRDCRIAR